VSSRSTDAGSRPTTCSVSAATDSGPSSRSSTAARISIAALAVGIAQAAYDAAVPYAQTRQQFGKRIGSFQGVAFMIADMATEIEAPEPLVWTSAWLKDQGRELTPLSAAEAKLFASEVSSRVTKRRDPGPRVATATSPNTPSSASFAMRS